MLFLPLPMLVDVNYKLHLYIFIYYKDFTIYFMSQKISSYLITTIIFNFNLKLCFLKSVSLSNTSEKNLNQFTRPAVSKPTKN